MQTQEQDQAGTAETAGSNANQGKEAAVGCAAISLVLLVVAGGISTCASKASNQQRAPVTAQVPARVDAPPPKKDLFAEMRKVPHVQRIERREKFIEVYVYQEPTNTTKYYVDTVAYVAWKIGNLISMDPSGLPAGIEDVVFVLNADLQDRLGNPSTEPTLSVTISLLDMKAARYENLSNQAVLDLSSSVGIVNTAGREMALAWCLEAQNGKAGSHVCAKFLAAD